MQPQHTACAVWNEAKWTLLLLLQLVHMAHKTQHRNQLCQQIGGSSSEPCDNWSQETVLGSWNVC